VLGELLYLIELEQGDLGALPRQHVRLVLQTSKLDLGPAGKIHSSGCSRGSAL
jgi:hypothetical protein